MGRVEIDNVEGLELVTTEDAVKRGLIPIGEPVIARNRFSLGNLIGRNPVYIPENLPERKKVVAYTEGDGIQESDGKGGYNAYIPVQLYSKK